jgi:hypothetical protein
MAVERAYVSTIHGLGLRLLTEHAFAAGASPQPRHLGDAERDLLIRRPWQTRNRWIQSRLSLSVSAMKQTGGRARPPKTLCAAGCCR